MKHVPTWLFLTAAALAPMPALAQAPDGGDMLKANAAELDTAIPEAPGFAVIGFSPTQVVDPSASRITLASLVNYVDEKGNLKPGLAVGGIPYLWLNPSLTLNQYRALRGFDAVMARTQVSAGYAEGGEGMANRLGFGFTTELFNDSDYRHDEKLYTCVRDAYLGLTSELSSGRPARRSAARLAAMKELNHGIVPPDTHPAWLRPDVLARAFVIENEMEAQLEQNFEGGSGVADCRTAAADRYAKSVRFTVAGGVALKSTGSGLDNADYDGASFWAAYRRPFMTERRVYATAFGRYDFDKKAATPAGGQQNYDRTTLALVAGYEPDERLKASVQAGYDRLDYRGAGPFADEKSTFYAATVTYRLDQLGLPAVYADLQAGSAAFAESPKDRDMRVKVTFRFAQPQK